MAKKSTARARAQTSASRGKPANRDSARKSSKKHVGDVLGISRARVPPDVPRATADRGGNPKGVEIGRARRRTQRLARTVGGVRGRGH